MGDELDVWVGLYAGVIVGAAAGLVLPYPVVVASMAATIAVHVAADAAVRRWCARGRRILP